MLNSKLTPAFTDTSSEATFSSPAKVKNWLFSFGREDRKETSCHAPGSWGIASQVHRGYEAFSLPVPLGKDGVRRRLSSSSKTSVPLGHGLGCSLKGSSVSEADSLPLKLAACCLWKRSPISGLHLKEISEWLGRCSELLIAAHLLGQSLILSPAQQLPLLTSQPHPWQAKSVRN